MDNVLLIGLSKQMALRNQMNVIANNMANVETSGFKGEKLLFREYVMPNAEVPGTDGTSRGVSYVLDQSAFRRFEEGAFVRTGNAFDVAINGEGWFAIETDAGERYTRNGHFKLNAQGELVTGNGARVLGTSGPIVLSPEETNFSVSSDGTISTSAGEKGKFQIVTFENQNMLKKTGDNLYATTATANPAEKVTLAQRVIERSNVEPVVEMSRMIEVMRSYMSTSRMLDNLAELKTRAIQRLGEVPN